MTPAIKYRRLPGRSGLFIRHSLWIKPDHILRVKAPPFSEEYRRYYFSDIQTLVLTELTNWAAIAGFVAAGLLAILTVTLLYGRHLIAAGIFGVCALIALLWSVRRPNCVCYLQTRVSKERLPSLKRLGAARKALAILQSEIESVQGAASREMIDARQSEVTIPEGRDPAVRPYTGFVHWIAFGLAVLRAVVGAVGLEWTTTSIAVAAAISVAGAGCLLTAIIAAFQQHRTDVSRGIRAMVYSLIGWYAFTGVGGFAFGIYAAITLGAKATNVSAVANLPFVKTFGVATIVGYAALGCAGLIASFLRGTSDNPPPLISGGTEFRTE